MDTGTTGAEPPRLAAKHSEPGGHIHLSADFSAKDEGCEVVLEVRDTGIDNLAAQLRAQDANRQCRTGDGFCFLLIWSTRRRPANSVRWRNRSLYSVPR